MTEERSERGAALPTIAIMLVVLLGMAAFAVDLGWLYLNANRLQKTTDAAALAGVVSIPSDPVQAELDAIDAARANGFPTGVTSSLVSTPLPDAKLQVDMVTSVPTFFMSVFGMNTVDIAKTSTAQYIRPVPLGSRGNCFGCPGSGFWGAINGQRTDKVDGDALLSECVGNKGNPSTCPTPNTEHRDSGYFYAIDVPAGASSVTVDIYNPSFIPGSFNAELPSDMGLGGEGLSHFTTEVTLRDADTTPYSPGETAAICTENYAPDGISGWDNLCTRPVTEGIYVLQIRSASPPVSGSQRQGSNQYGVRATVDAGEARVYALNEMSIFTNKLGSITELDLAEIEAVHAGKRLEIRLFDPGDISRGHGAIFLEVMSPTGATPCLVNGAAHNPCNVQVAHAATCPTTPDPDEPPEPCGNLFNGSWIDILVDIPNDYACSTDCWWHVNYDLSGGEGGDTGEGGLVFTGEPTDRTVWTARVIGSPIRLVPNGS
jgi:hypothetical protein